MLMPCSPHREDQLSTTNLIRHFGQKLWESAFIIPFGRVSEGIQRPHPMILKLADDGIRQEGEKLVTDHLPLAGRQVANAPDVSNDVGKDRVQAVQAGKDVVYHGLIAELPQASQDESNESKVGFTWVGNFFSEHFRQVQGIDKGLLVIVEVVVVDLLGADVDPQFRGELGETCLH